MSSVRTFEFLTKRLCFLILATKEIQLYFLWLLSSVALFWWRDILCFKKLPRKGVEPSRLVLEDHPTLCKIQRPHFSPMSHTLDARFIEILATSFQTRPGKSASSFVPHPSLSSFAGSATTLGYPLPFTKYFMGQK